MINLLPDHIKEEITYGHHNRVLLHWLISVMLIIGGIGAMTVFGELFINKNINTLQSVVKITQDRISDQNLQSTQASIQNLSNNFKTVTQLLSKQLLFSKLFVKIGSIIPSGAILSGITLSNTDAALDINIASTTQNTATQAFVNINDPANGLFDKADLVSVSCTQSNPSNSTTLGKYPCVTLIKVVMKTNSSFYFLNSITNGAKS